MPLTAAGLPLLFAVIVSDEIVELVSGGAQHMACGLLQMIPICFLPLTKSDCFSMLFCSEGMKE